MTQTDPEAPAAPTSPPDRPTRRRWSPLHRRRRPRRRWSRRRRLLTLGVVLALLIPVTVSYIQALTYPGNASWSTRTVEWIRAHGGSPLVDHIETWYYERKAPPTAGPPDDPLTFTTPSPGTSRQPRLSGPATAPVVQLIATAAPLPGEGVWRPLEPHHLLWGTWLRSDPRHLPVTATAVLVPRGQAVLHLRPGTRDPVSGTPTSAARVPTSDRAALLATFNAGFKMRDSRGGWMDGSKTAGALKPGRASLVIDRSGGWSIGIWRQTVGPGPQVVAVRQNLNLVVAHGSPVPGLTTNPTGVWGNAHQQFQYTWRSGLGVDAAGDLVYVAGRSMNLSMLAQAMARVGIVTGMQLDIHPNMVDFNIDQGIGPGGAPRMRLLIRAMGGSPNRYLSADQRDFFYLTRATQ